MYSSRSMTDSYLSRDSSRYMLSGPYSSSEAYSRIPGVASQSSWLGPPGVDVGSTAASDSFLAGTKRSSTETLYHENIYGAYSTIGQTEAWYSTNPLAKRPRSDSASNLPIYPQRPGEKDCAHYMLTRTCKFGESCKFDHPIWVPEGGIPDWKEVPLNTNSELLPERSGEPDCPYFLKTQWCKFGMRCKFNHPKDKIAHSLQGMINDIAALPERPTEPPCAFYMKTGKCNFGATCKFHHPKNVLMQASGLGSVDENPANAIAAPALMHNSKGLPVRPGEADCTFYLKMGSCKYGAVCRFNHPDRNTITHTAAAIAPTFVASPVTPLNIGVVNPTASIMQSYDPRLSQTPLVMAPTIYPQRPGHIECDYYMKTGVCKFGSTCKFHHPIDRSAPMVLANEAPQQNVKLTLAGLPRREGAIHCPYYMKTGTCKYGATCKFDHPPPAEVMAIATSQGATVSGGIEAE